VNSPTSELSCAEYLLGKPANLPLILGRNQFRWTHFSNW
jgi:hypothetical protein